MYDVNIFYDNAELIYFGVEKQDQSKPNSSSDKISSSIGSVNSVAEPFPLPAVTSTVTSTNSTLSSSSELTQPFTSNLDKKRSEIKGTVALCDFVIEHFQKIRKNVIGSTRDASPQSIETTPVSTSGRRKSSVNATPTTTINSSKRKRGLALIDNEIDESVKSAKKSKPSTPSTVTASPASNYPEKAVLARWIDKKFYAGRVIEQKPNSKFVVLFEDGAKKVLPEEHIVFGEENILPLIDECVHAAVKEDTFEPGIVQSVDTTDDGIYYTVLCESKTVKVTASDIYLEEDQAKVILSKHASNAANNPEPGFSGGVNTRKDRRQKRYS